MRLALLLLLLASPAAAHDLSLHDDLPYLAADCAGYLQARARAEGDTAAQARADGFRAAAKALDPALSADIDYVLDTATTRTRQMLKDAAQISGAQRLLTEQEAFCKGVAEALPEKWGLR